MSQNPTNNISQLILIIDEQDPAFQFEGDWVLSYATQWYETRSWYGTGSATLSFNGTSVAIIGDTPPSSEYALGSPLTHNVSIDNQTTYATAFPLPNEANPGVTQSYRQWYTSPILKSGFHTLNLSNNHAAAVDFALVTISDPDTPLDSSQRVFVDDQDPAIRYTGSWKNNTNSPFINFTPLPGGWPIANTTHQSQANGDCLEFRFTGTTLEAYGLWYPPTPDSSQINLFITLDGAVQPSGPIIGSANSRYQNLLIYSNTGLLDGPHTLKLTVQGNTQFFFLDYFTYAPSFSSIRDMPDLSAGYKGCWTGGDGNPVQVGLIVGVVLGLFTFGLLVILGVWKWKKRRRRRRRVSPMKPSGSQIQVDVGELEPPQARRREPSRPEYTAVELSEPKSATSPSKDSPPRIPTPEPGSVVVDLSQFKSSTGSGGMP